MSDSLLEKYNTDKYIIIKGAKIHNLKNISLAIERNKLTVITGLSGSGKSSLAFDTLFAEGQRRYVESLSSYARQFLGRMNKPEVEYIKGICPAIAIEQKVNISNPRSTVGTSTEIYEYLKLLFARIGVTYSPVSHNIVKRHSVSDVVDFVVSLKENTKVIFLAPLILKANRKISEQLSIILSEGFTRIFFNENIYEIDDVLSNNLNFDSEDIFIVIDRLMVKNNDKSFVNRVSDSVQTAFYEGDGKCVIQYFDDNKRIDKLFSNKFELDGISFVKPSANFFSFNNPYGACKRCNGFGYVIGIDPDKVIPDKSLSVYDGAISCWRGEKSSKWNDELVLNAYKFDFPIHKPYYELSDKQKDILWKGNKYFKGLNAFFKYVKEKSYKIQYRVMLSRYRGKTLCKDCKGTRLRKDANYVKIAKKSISDIVLMPVNQSLKFFKNINLNEHDKKVAKRLIHEIINRLQLLNDVGLGYLTLNRLSSTLSGGESQRINLATSLGSSLMGSMYILDEPSIGLHPRDTDNLIKVLLKLRDIGNTVIVVEHDENIIKAADQIIDIGPYAGERGGEIVFQGTFNELLKDNVSLTSKYFNKKLKILSPEKTRKWKYYIEVKGASENNLKNIDVKFPLNTLNLVTGVSGSGKSSLVKLILYPALKKLKDGYAGKTGSYNRITGDINKIYDVQYVDQNPIGRSSRSNPATYIKAYDDIRNLYAAQRLSKLRGYKPGFFSFNVEGGRCETCKGDGVVKIEMQFMADLFLSCPDCKGKRFKDEVLDVKYRGKDITEVLNMTVNNAIEFFSTAEKITSYEEKIISKLKPLQDVGLGYIKLGQPSNTISGGEAQRIKLAYFLSKGSNSNPTLFIFDEPSTGLHYYDINKLLISFNALIDKGHSIIVIEHNMEIIKNADWIIDLGPEGGKKGGNVLFQGSPADFIFCPDSYTASYFRSKCD
ncbi:MAG: excinuclease ABC subunit UvrA [Bacteroidales bacterium]|nr:excinuclease ABC subunit UvrA [Bacteroidales bacterium]